MPPAGSPYRSRQGPRPGARRLAFHHFRITLAVTAVLTALALAASFTTTPRQLRVHCEPVTGPALSCDSTERSLWGIGERRKERVPSEPQLLPWALGARPLGLESLDVTIEHGVGRHRSSSRVVARFAQGPSVALTDWRPSGDSLVEELFAFERGLREGRPATLEYRSGWGGWTASLPLALAALALFWVFTGRTRIVFNPDTGVVETATRSQWLLPAKRRSFARDEIVEAFAAQRVGRNDRKIHLPALRLKSGEHFLFGELGSATPVRAELLAKQINRLLETEESRP